MREIVFVDGSVPDSRQLVQGLQGQHRNDRVLDIVALQTDEDGVARIGETLSRAQDLRAIHIISHGDDGVLQLGGTRLDSKRLARNAQEIANWGSAFSADADLLLYGCNVARGVGGKAFVRDLARLTGAGVAASTDLTGQRALGGNWTLEYATDRIETNLVIETTMQQAWAGLLAVTTVNAVKDTYIKKKKVDENYGAATELIIDRETNDLHRALLQFDFSAIPAGATINSATLKMQATDVGGDLSVAVYEVLQSWSEGTGNGDAGEANWNNRMASTAWSTAGGSFNPTAVATIFNPAAGQHAWNVTPLVQAWVAGTKTNNGLMVASPDGGGDRTVTYSSREGATVPFLEISYGSNISGTIFEDANFAGTAAEYDGGTNDLALANVDVELYDNSDTYITSVITDGTGGYSFTGLDDGTYKVRVRSATVGDADTPPKGGLNATVPATWPYPLPELAWANGAALYGGQSPTVDDTATADNAGPGDTYVAVTVSGANVTSVNFGFAYNLIVNTGDDTKADNVRSKQGSLRQFIKNANSIGTAGGTTANISQFRIPNGLLDGNGVASIAPLAALPNINDTTGGTTIDGTTQTTNQGNTNSLGPEVEIRGFPTSFTYGLELNSANNTVNGLIINGFSGTLSAGIMITGASATGNTVTGNYLGTDYSSSAAVANYIGVAIGAGAQSNTVGGTSVAERNVISGNSTYGAEIKDSGTDLNVVKGNYIGTDRLGTTAVANGTGAIIWAGAANNKIGGNAVGEGNVISASTSTGLIIANSGSDNNVVQGNLIGTDASGTGNLGNGSSGININQGALNNTIGGTATREANTIAFNSGDGISMNSSGTDGNQVSGNSIFQNGGLGIDLDPDGVGTGSGANNDKAAPIITSITHSGSDFTIVATAGSGDTVEFFRVNNAAAPLATADPSGSGEGYLYLGSCVDNGACSGPHISAVADADAVAGSIRAVLLSSGVSVGDAVSATATDSSNNTSEFSVNALAQGAADLVLTLTDNPDPAASGGDLLYTLLITNNGPDTATGVVATNVLPAGVTLQSATPNQGSCSGTTTVTCDLGAILNSGTASIEILVVTSGTGTLTDNASVTANESDSVPGNNTASANTSVVVGSGFGTPLSQFRRIHSFVDSTVTGGTLRTGSNGGNPCAVGASSTATLSGIPATATVVGAYLYWAGSGSTVDDQVFLNGGSPLTADRTFTARYVISPTNYDFFGGFKDVTAQVQTTRNGDYTFSGLTVSTGNPYCSSKAVLAGWSLIVIYQDNSLTGKTLVLYDGFDIERNWSAAYNLSGIYASTPPEGKATYLVWEGDPDLSGATERQVFNGTALSDPFNPSDNSYNSTINTLGVNNSYGVDLDTFNVSSYVNGGDTLATTTVSVAQDLVILNAVLLQVKSNVITGTIFEDVNYGGGAGRDLATAVASALGFTVPRPGAVVELYDAAGNFLRTTTTDATGRYGFSGLPDGDYTVRAVNDSVNSSRPGATGNEKAVQTYRADAGTGTAVAVTNEVGGANPAGQDAPANTTNQNLGSFFSQSKAPAKIVTGVAVTNVDFGFNFSTVINTNDTGQGSLRQFFTNANALGNTGLAQTGKTAGIETSIFQIPGAGPFSIQPATVLPTVTDPVVLDGTTQPGWTSAPIIELNGNMAVADGLTITAGGSTIRGLVINRFTTNGINITAGSSNTIVSNYIGTNVAGTAQAGNNEQGIRIADSTGNTIGGTSTVDRNVISGNRLRGILIEETAASGNQVLGNFIGTNAAGTATLTNQQIGVYIWNAPNNVIGGTAAGAGNVLSGNTWHGVYAWGANATGNFILGNTIGLDVNRAFAIPNGDSLTRGGITISSAPGNTIGGTASGAENVISGNTGRGIIISGVNATGNLIQSNAIYGNGSIGIDLSIDGVTANDDAKTSGQPNLLMDFPVFTAATLLGTNLFVNGYIGSAPDQAVFDSARVEIFKSDNDPSGHGEGQTFLGFLTADGNGNFNGTIDVSGKGLAAGENITGTATDGSNNTSEFGTHQIVVAPAVTIEDVTEIEGTGLEFTVTLDNAVSGGFDVTVGFTDGTATGGGVPLAEPEDYANDAVTLNFAGTASETQTFTVATLDDASLEGNETFTVILSASNPNVDASDTAVGTITENDTDLVVTKTVDNGTPDEGGIITFTVTVTNNGSVQVTNVSLEDALPVGLTIGTVTPSQGSYTAPTWTIGTIAAGSSVTLDIPATVNAGTAGSTITNAVTNVTLDQTDSNTTADDLSEAVTVGNSTDLVIGKTVDNSTPNEGETVNFTVRVTNSGPARATNVSIEDALPVGLTAGTITPSQGSYTAPTWTIGAIDSASSATLTIQASVNPGTAGSTITNTVTNVTLDQVDSNATADDLSEAITVGAILIEFDSAARSDDEASGGNIPQLLISGTSASARTIDVTISGGTATDGDDYTLTTTVTIPAGIYDGTLATAITVPLVIIDDSVVEADETVILALSNPGVGFSIGDANGDASTQSNHTYTILDDDSAGVTVSAISGTTAETGTTATFTVVLDSQPSAPVSIAITSGDLTEGTLSPSPLIFDGTNWNVAQTVTVTGVNDFEVDGDITYTVSVEAATSTDTHYDGLDPADVSVTNIDDDSATVQFAAASSSVAENSGTLNVFVQLNVSGSGTLGSDVTVQVVDLGTGSAAASGVDYTFSTPTLVTFAAGSGDGATRNVTIALTNDGLTEADEDLDLQLQNVTGPAIISSANADHQVTIIDEDSVSISISDVTAAEGNGGTTDFIFTVSIDQAHPTNPVTVDFTTVDDTATAGSDYTAASGTLTFAAGTATLSQQIIVPVSGDAAIEPDERFFVNLSNASANATIMDNQGLGTITNDDSAAITINDVTAAEGNAPGTTNFVFTVTLSVADPTNPVTVDFTTADDTATAGSDYTATSGTLTFAAGTATLTQQVTVTVSGDELVEADESFFVNLSNASANATITDNQGLGTITNDDSAAVTISDATAVEGVGLQFTATLDTAVSGAFTVTTGYGDITTDDLDYDHTAQVLNFAGTAGENHQFTVATTDDALVEGAETFTVTLTASNPLVTTTDTATGTITDNDAAALSINDVTHTEGDAGNTAFTFTVSIGGGVTSTGDITFAYDTADDTAAAGSDYTAVVGGTGTIAAGTASTTITVAVSGDTLVETDERFFVNLSNVVGAFLTDDQGLGTITNDDEYPAITSALAEINSTTVNTNEVGHLFSYDVLPTINGGNSGLDRVTITAPAGYSHMNVTAVSVGGSPISTGCPTPGVGQYCAQFTGQDMSVTLGGKITASLTHINVQFTADTPGVAGSADFMAIVDDTSTAVAPQPISVGNADGDPNDANSITVTVVNVVSALLSSVSADPQIVPADGTTVSTIFVRLRDDQNNPVPGKNIQLASDRAADVVISPLGPTDANGVATGTISSTEPGAAVITATDVTDGLTLSQHPVVYFTQGQVLELNLTANKNEVVVGDIVTYLAVLKNTTATDVVQVHLDITPPPGFVYLKNSARLNGSPLADPTGGRPLIFDIGTVPAHNDANGNGQVDRDEAGYVPIVFQLAIGSGAGPGDYDTHAVARDVCPSCFISNPAEATVTVTLDPIFDLGTIIGKVFYDHNRNGWQDPGEDGAGGVMVALDSGVYALTDPYGRYHFPAVEPGHRMVKINLKSLADGAEATTHETVVLDITPGLMAKANFGVLYKPETIRTGKPAEPGIAIESKAVKQPIQILGNVDSLTLMINGEVVVVPKGNVRLMVENLNEVVELKGGRLEKPVQFQVDRNFDVPVKSWELKIMDPKGDVVHVLSGSGEPPEVIDWNGKLGKNQRIRGGDIYQYQLALENQDGSRTASDRRIFGINQAKVISVNLTGEAFVSNSAELSQKAREILKETAKILWKFPDEKVIIEGHTDSVGSDAYNLELSKKRALSALNFLVKEEGLPEDRFVVRWYGESRPIATNEFPETRALNRRIEIKGQMNETERSKLYDQYRTEAAVKINGEALPLDGSRFSIHVSDDQLKRFTVEVINKRGQSLRTSFGVPEVEILKTDDTVLLPFGAAGPGYSVIGADRVASPAQAALATYTVQGRTEPGNTIEVDGIPIPVKSDGSFTIPLELRRGSNPFGLLVRNASGTIRLVNLMVTVNDRDQNGELILATEPIPNLMVQLPPRGAPLTQPILAITGATDPGNRVEINGEAVAVAADGTFTTSVSLPPGASEVVIKAIDAKGRIGEIRRAVEFKDTDLFFLAFGDGKVGWLKSKGYLEGTDKEQGFYTDGRIAFYLKGVIKGKYLVTAAMDTGHSEFEDLFKDLDDKQTERLLTNLDPDKIYPVYGDSSTVVYDTDSRGKFFLALDSDEFHALVGNYQVSLTDTELARYQRTFFGANAAYQSLSKTRYGNPNTKVLVFGAEVQQLHVNDQLEATGGSLYYLSHRDIIEGSEQVSLVVRDKNTGLVISRTPQQQNVDYTIKYDTGYILFHRPITSKAPDGSIINQDILPGNPVIVEVEYEALADSLDKKAYGGRVRQQIGDHVAVGGTYIKDDLGTESYTLQGVDTEVRLGDDTRLIGEYAKSEGAGNEVFLSVDGGLNFRDTTPLGGQNGDAYKLAAEVDVGEWFERPDRYFMGAYYKRQNPGFFNEGNLLQTGTENIGMNLSFKLSEADILRGKLERTEIDATENVDSTSETIGTLQYIHDHSWWGVTLEYQSRNRDGEQVTSEAGDNSYAAAGLRVDATDDLTLNLDYQQTVTGPTNNQARLGTRYQVHPNLALEAVGTVGSEGQSALGGAVLKIDDKELYINQRIADSRPGRSTATVVGARALVDPSTKMYTEYQWENLEDNTRNVSVVGAERQWEMGEGLKLLLSGEYGSIAAESGDIDRYAIAGGVNYSHPAGFKAASRQEFRREDGLETIVQFLSSNNLELKLNPDFTLLGKLRFSNTHNTDTDEKAAGFREYSLGLAYRPVAFDRFNALAKYTLLSDEGPRRADELLLSDTQSQVASIEWIFDVTRNLQWVEKFAYKMESETVGDLPQQDTQTMLSISRLNWNFWRKFGLGLEYRLLTQLEPKNSQNGWLTELMWEPIDHFRIGVGYNFTDFSDNEFAENDHSYGGAFFRFQVTY